MMEETKLFQGEFNQIAKLWRRAVAYIADGLILSIPVFLIIFAYSFILTKGNFSSIPPDVFRPENITKALFLQIAVWALTLSYFTYFIGKTGQTLGKKAMGVKVVSSDGNVIGYRKAFLRYLFFFLYSLGSVGLTIFIISSILGMVDKQKRMLHDRACKTFVIGKEVEEAIEKVRQEGKPRLAGAAIFALALSIFCFVIPIVGQLICFYVAGRVLYDIKQSKGLLKGKSLAIAAIIISVFYLVAFAILFLFIIPAPK